MANLIKTMPLKIWLGGGFVGSGSKSAPPVVPPSNKNNYNNNSKRLDIRGGGSSSSSSGSMMISGLGQRVVNFLELAIHVTHCLYQRPIIPFLEYNIGPMTDLARSILLDIPYGGGGGDGDDLLLLADNNNNNNNKHDHHGHHRLLCHEASKLCSLFGHLVLQNYYCEGQQSSFQQQQSHRLLNQDDDNAAATMTMTTTSNSNRRRTSVGNAVLTVLITAMGGLVTPQGQLTPMALPVQEWLSTNSGKEFIQKIISVIAHSSGQHHGAEKGERKQQNSSPVAFTSGRLSKLLCAVLRTRPQTGLSHDHWENLQATICQLANSPNAQERLMGMEIIEGLVLGRKDFGFEPAHDVEKDITSAFVTLVTSTLRHARIDPNDQCRCVAFHIYGGLLPSDWIAIGRLSTDEGTPVLEHARAILTCCLESSASTDTPGEMNAKVRSAACKAIGDISVHLLSSFSRTDGTLLSEIDCAELATDIYSTMLDATNDANASVRSMVSTFYSKEYLQTETEHIASKGSKTYIFGLR